VFDEHYCVGAQALALGGSLSLAEQLMGQCTIGNLCRADGVVRDHLAEFFIIDLPAAILTGAIVKQLPGLLAARGASSAVPALSGRAPAAAELADQVAAATGGTLKPLGTGYSVTIPQGSRGVVVRVMESGGGRTNYYRVSVPGKQAYTVDGVASADRVLTHIDIAASSLDDILRIVASAG